MYLFSLFKAQTGTPEGLRTTTDVQQYVPLPSTGMEGDEAEAISQGLGLVPDLGYGWTQ